MFGVSSTRAAQVALGRIRSVLLAATVCGFVAVPAQAGEAFRIGTSPTGILVWLAEDLGLFAEHGVSVEVSKVSSGVEALDLVQSGGLDLGASSEFAFISRALDDPGLCIFATISASRTVTLLARSDRIAGGPESLTGTRIGVTLGSVARFMLWQFLALSGVEEKDVTLVDLTPDQLVEAMRDGTVDAGIVWEPYVTLIRREATVDLLEFKEQTDQHYYFTLQGRCDLAQRRAGDMAAVLEALMAAERHVRTDEVAAKAMFARRSGIATDEVDRIWPMHSLSVRLPQDLVSLMEQQVEWRIAEGLADRTDPDVLRRIQFVPLAKVAPDAVQIIR